MRHLRLWDALVLAIHHCPLAQLSILDPLLKLLLAHKEIVHCMLLTRPHGSARAHTVCMQLHRLSSCESPLLGQHAVQLMITREYCYAGTRTGAASHAICSASPARIMTLLLQEANLQGVRQARVSAALLHYCLYPVHCTDALWPRYHMGHAVHEATRQPAHAPS